MNTQDDALLSLLARLRERDYRFVAPTPETHRRVIAPRNEAEDLRGVLGWSLPFAPDLLPADIFDLLSRAGALQTEGGRFRSKLRVASLGDSLFLHSAFPTDAADSVFFGPDSYRFVAFVERELAGRPAPRNLVDIGAGSGVGGICAARMFPGLRPTLADVNPAALRLARINAIANGVEAQLVETSGIDAIDGKIAVAVANPPFLADAGKRTYRDGGNMLGAALSLDWALAAAAKLEPGGRMLLYTGSAIVGGRDGLKQTLEDGLEHKAFSLRYAEIDPDIFGEQLDEAGYEAVERIAAIGAVIERTG